MSWILCDDGEFRFAQETVRNSHIFDTRDDSLTEVALATESADKHLIVGQNSPQQSENRKQEDLVQSNNVSQVEDTLESKINLNRLSNFNLIGSSKGKKKSTKSAKDKTKGKSTKKKTGDKKAKNKKQSKSKKKDKKTAQRKKQQKHQAIKVAKTRVLNQRKKSSETKLYLKLENVSNQENNGR